MGIVLDLQYIKKHPVIACIIANEVNAIFVSCGEIIGLLGKDLIHHNKLIQEVCSNETEMQ